VSAEAREIIDTTAERSLDPEDWERFRALGHRAFDDLVEYLQGVRERPVWQPLPEAARRLLAEGPPESGTEPEIVYQQVRDHILPYPTGNIHPRFWSWVGGTGTPVQLVADMVISAMNAAGLGFDETASTHVELQLLDWLKEMLGFPQDTSGLLVSGGSMANLVGLAVARTHAAPYDVRRTGIDRTARPRMVFYGSAETHSSVQKAVELLGLGHESLRLVPVREDYTIDVGALCDSIAHDRREGLLPACIIANVGTVNTGAVDPVNELADIAARNSMWLHADAAFGAFARLSTSCGPLVEGLERVDSLAFDLHKWLYVQYDCGCALVRHPDVHRDTFSVSPPYLKKLDRGLATGPFNFSEYGVQLSRSFKALRAWMALKSEGIARYRQQIEQNVQQARYLARRVTERPMLELLAPVPLNIVNFRYRGALVDEQALNELNAELLMRLQEKGIAAPSSTVLRGRFAIRVAICNHRSRREDFDLLVESVVAIGDRISDEIARG
jgi:glutamate/tyrosine decarboxylase-like PLP-dependent enzyme